VIQITRAENPLHADTISSGFAGKSGKKSDFRWLLKKHFSVIASEARQSRLL